MSMLQHGETPAEKRRRLVKLLLEQKPAEHRPVSQVPRRQTTDPPPLSFAQQRLWFLDKLVPDSPFYNIPAAVRIRAPLDVNVWRATLNEIVRRHDVLRTSFPEVANRPVQVVAPHLEIPFSVVDLRSQDEAAREQELLRLATEDACRPFDLRRGPLVRASVLWLGEQDYVLLVNLHHIVADGWSMGVLIDEVQKIYDAFVRGLPSPLPALAIQYADFSLWQHARLADGGLQKQLNYW